MLVMLQMNIQGDGSSSCRMGFFLLETWMMVLKRMWMLLLRCLVNMVCSMRRRCPCYIDWLS